MSGEESRKAQNLSEEENRVLKLQLRPLTSVRMKDWLEIIANKEKLQGASDDVKKMVEKKLGSKIDLEPIEEVLVEQSKPESPAIVKEISISVPPPPPESRDIEYLTLEEVKFDRTINTLNTVLIEDRDVNPENHPGPWVERCVGRNKQSGNLMVLRIPARDRTIPPWEVVKYNGSVVQDKMATHSTTVIVNGVRTIHVFDKFYIHNKRRYERCCWIPDPVHQAGILYTRYVNPTTKLASAAIARISKESTDPKYEVVGAQEGGGTKEGYYRDLKRLFERHFLRRGEGAKPEDEALTKLINKIQP